MPMITTLTLRYEGAPSCADCQRTGIPVCDHVGFTPEAWDYAPGRRVEVPGLDATYEHVVQQVVISPDRKAVTLTVETFRAGHLDLARHLSLLGVAKSAIRAVHHETGETLAEGRYDYLLQQGQQVWINTDAYLVARVEHPNRNEYGVVESGELDVQVARLMPQQDATVQPVRGNS